LPVKECTKRGPFVGERMAREVRWRGIGGMMIRGFIVKRREVEWSRVFTQGGYQSSTKRILDVGRCHSEEVPKS